MSKQWLRLALLLSYLGLLSPITAIAEEGVAFDLRSGSAQAGAKPEEKARPGAPGLETPAERRARVLARRREIRRQRLEALRSGQPSSDELTQTPIPPLESSPRGVVVEESVIKEDTKQVKEAFDKDLVSTGLDAVLLLDSSGSMRRTDPGRLRDQGTKLFLRFLGPNDRVAIYRFDTDVVKLHDLQAVSKTGLPSLDKAVDSIVNDGGFTDLQLPVEIARKLLQEQGRHDAAKAIVLFSDGIMDPHPKRGTPEVLTKVLKERDLPGLKKDGVPLYTIAFSDESDRKLLSKMAEIADGKFWFASDVDTVHLRFSDLFLSLKKPQVLALEESGFTIDAGIREATFYITRKQSAGHITLVMPNGRRVTNRELPANVKWYKGEFFDVVTIEKPLPGMWSVDGIDDVEGFATLLTDIKLQAKWPATTIAVGDRVVVMARLIEDGQVVQKPGMQEITFYTYRIIDTHSGQVVLQGVMNDKGADGDSKAGDGIYSATVALPHAGSFRAFVVATSPTFTRQQVTALQSRAGLVRVELELDEGVEPIAVSVKTFGEIREEVVVQLLMKPRDGGKVLATQLKAVADNHYEGVVPKVAGGDYEIYARVQGKDKTLAQSPSIDFVVDDEIEEIEPEEIEEKIPFDYSPVIGGFYLVLAFVWVSGLGVFSYRSAKKQVFAAGGKQIISSIAASTLERVDQLRQKSSTSNRREPTPADQELFDKLLSVSVDDDDEAQNNVQEEVGGENVEAEDSIDNEGALEPSDTEEEVVSSQAEAVDARAQPIDHAEATEPDASKSVSSEEPSPGSELTQAYDPEALADVAEMNEELTEIDTLTSDSSDAVEEETLKENEAVPSAADEGEVVEETDDLPERTEEVAPTDEENDEPSDEPDRGKD